MYRPRPQGNFKRVTSLKKQTLAQVSSCEFCEFFKHTFFKKHLWTIDFGRNEEFQENYKKWF